MEPALPPDDAIAPRPVDLRARTGTGDDERARLAAVRDRVRPAPVALPAPAGLAEGLDRAAERLRLAAPAAPAAAAPGRARRVLRRLFR